ncbi:MAG: deoxyhypusine synthase family protein [Desulfovibrionaceae bacterium]|nr:deoxyhypusine synthase family protein [Desulfovibrionaceae bacterium]
MKKRRFQNLRDGLEDGLVPLRTLDPDEIEDFDGLLSAMSRTAFGGRRLGEALDVLEAMVLDKDCLVVGTFSGAMTVAKMSKLLIKMIDQGWLDVVISTGALMAHGLIESIGLKHFKHDPLTMNDQDLFKSGYNRVYDTLEPELNFVQAEEDLRRVMGELRAEGTICSETFCRVIGRHLSRNYDGPGILKSAYEKGVPVFIPAFTDSELALDLAKNMLEERFDLLTGEAGPEAMPFQFNPFLDLMGYTRRLLKAERLGIFTIGGGVPRNWAQQVGPFVETINSRMPEKNLPAKRFSYALRVCPEPDHWGGLSGCTYKEGVSWGKFTPPSEGGRFAEVHCDATIAWPILVRGLMDRLAKK